MDNLENENVSTENIVLNETIENKTTDNNTKSLGENISTLLSLLNFVIIVIFLYNYLKTTFFIRKG